MRIPRELVVRLMKDSQSKMSPPLLRSDTNEHNEIQGSSDTNRKFEYLIKFMTGAGQEVLDIDIAITLMKLATEGPWRSRHRIMRSDIESNSVVHLEVVLISEMNWNWKQRWPTSIRS